LNFYQKHIGDFNNATRHLTRVERSLFSDAIELYYDTEKELTSDFEKLARLLLAHSDEEKTSLRTVLSEFFTLTDTGYFNKRCNEEIVKYHGFKESRSRAGKASAEQRASAKATTVEHVLNTEATNHKPLTINHTKKTLVSAPPSRFEDFWNEWPKTERRTGKAKCLAKWKARKLDDKASLIIDHVKAMKLTRKWMDGFEPAPMTYINGSLWTDEVLHDPKPVNGSKSTTAHLGMDDNLLMNLARTAKISTTGLTKPQMVSKINAKLGVH